MASQTWTDTSGDWKTATLWASGTIPGTADTAIFNTTSAYLATVGTSTSAAEADLVAAVTLADAAATLQIQHGSTLTTTGTFSLLAGSLELDGDLAGGVLLGGAGDIELDYAIAGTLSHETISNSVTVTGYGGTLDAVGGLGFVSAANLIFDGQSSTLAVTGGLGLVTGSTLTLGGYGNLLQFLDAETLAAGEILATGYGDTLAAGTTTPVTFGSGFTLDVAGEATLTGSVINKGVIEVGEDDTLTLNPASLTNSGVIALAAEAELEIGSVTTGQVTSLAAGVTAGAGGPRSSSRARSTTPARSSTTPPAAWQRNSTSRARRCCAAPSSRRRFPQTCSSARSRA